MGVNIEKKEGDDFYTVTVPKGTRKLIATVTVKSTGQKMSAELLLVDKDECISNDIYISEVTGGIYHKFGNGEGNVRAIDSVDWEIANDKEDLCEKIKYLEQKSYIVTVDNLKIQEDLQEIHSRTTDAEEQLFIVLDRNSQKITSIIGSRGKKGKIPFSTSPVHSNRGITIEHNGILYAFFGQVHTHDLISKEEREKGRENAFGTSKDDEIVAKTTKCPIYALDSWNFFSKSARVTINRVIPQGIHTKKIGKTYGKKDKKTGEIDLGGTVDIGLECLNYRIERL
ncbi:hypothetical protein [Capnocytophaga catalasegens]|uniref:Uncharacterized protein n=1 Tax=Capnocytophaga catalasegens TaxID=1004260 RepID=A0AAV5AS21_9FLAO|nr:hypothetical protein [Capnocytophaga catalasegens]GIZ14920.1 hypothetical protein RCZ03_09200 [Capnocytophaga catalasegens]GJM49299.1 hypothetical protein RCZ15_02740 [Capnocytophaga catalasegens]GJM52450.1 hypothetical protein RCZ16_07670 [Capnocytophaga catalasegens]